MPTWSSYVYYSVFWHQLQVVRLNERNHFTSGVSENPDKLLKINLKHSHRNGFSFHVFVFFFLFFCCLFCFFNITETTFRVDAISITNSRICCLSFPFRPASKQPFSHQMGYFTILPFVVVLDSSSDKLHYIPLLNIQHKFNWMNYFMTERRI